MVDWWSEPEQAILERLETGGATSPEDLARRVGMSERDTLAFVCMLAREGRLRIHLVGVEREPAAATGAGHAWESAA